METKRLCRLLVAMACLLPLLASAAALEGRRQIVLSNAAGERHVIGHVDFADAGQGKQSFAVEMNDSMEDYFLAMRPFRCLTGAQQRLCWFPVKNEESVISDGDLLPLEYALMFMRTRTHDLHVNPFNGLYYQLQREDDRHEERQRHQEGVQVARRVVPEAHGRGELARGGVGVDIAQVVGDQDRRRERPDRNGDADADGVDAPAHDKLRAAHGDESEEHEHGDLAEPGIPVRPRTSGVEPRGEDADSADQDQPPVGCQRQPHARTLG